MDSHNEKTLRTTLGDITHHGSTGSNRAEHRHSDGLESIENIINQKESCRHANQEEELGKTINWWIKVVQYIAGILVIINCLTMGLEADHPEWTNVWYISERLFSFAFFCEMVFKLCTEHLGYFTDPFNWLDFSLVILSVFDIFVLPVIFGSEPTSMQSLRAIRLLRLPRLMRIFRVIRNFTQITVMFKGIAHAVKCAFWVCCVVLLIVYVFAIFTTTYIGKAPDVSQYPGYTMDEVALEDLEIISEFNPYLSFGSMIKSMLTLCNVAILAQWADIVWPIMLKQPVYVLPFIVFICFVTFGAMNVIVAMIVDNVIRNIDEVNAQANVAVRDYKLSALARVKGLILPMDLDGDGYICKNELFQELTVNDELVHLLKEFGFPESYNVEELFRLFDSSGDNLLHLNEFYISLYRLITNSDFQWKCMLQMNSNELKATAIELKASVSEMADVLNEKFRKLEAAMDHSGVGLTGSTSKCLPHPDNIRRLDPPCGATFSPGSQDYDMYGMVSMDRPGAFSAPAEVQISAVGSIKSSIDNQIPNTNFENCILDTPHIWYRDFEQRVSDILATVRYNGSTNLHQVVDLLALVADHSQLQGSIKQAPNHTAWERDSGAMEGKQSNLQLEEMPLTDTQRTGARMRCKSQSDYCLPRSPHLRQHIKCASLRAPCPKPGHIHA